MNTTKISRRVCIAGAIAATWIAAAGPVAAQDGVSFAGRTVTATVGFEAGNRVDLYARLLGQVMMRYLPGQPNLIVMNRPGAGGVIALNDWVAKAEPNGLSIAVGGSTQVDMEALSRMQARYRPSQLKYIGGLMSPSQGLMLNKAAVARLTDKSAPPVTMGIVGSSMRTGYYQVLWGAAFLDWNIKWVRGYKSTAEVRNAVERGEVDMSSFGTATDLQHLLDTGRVIVASQSGAVVNGTLSSRRLFGDAPISADRVRGKIKDPLAQQAYDYSERVIQVGMWIALPPGTPDNIVATYVRAFEQAIEDPDFKTPWSKADPDSPAASKAVLETMIRGLETVSPEALKFIRDELRRQGAEISEL